MGGPAAAVATAVVGVLLAAACSGGARSAGPTATVARATTTTDPYAPPAVIDVAYVNRVLAGLDQVVGEVVRMALRDRAVTPEAEVYLRALYADGDAGFGLHRDSLRQGAEESQADVRPRPGNQATTVARLITVGPDCIFAQVQRDLSPVVFHPNPDLVVLWVGLKPLDRSRDPGHLNPTPWMYVYDGFPRDHTQPEDPCAGP